MHNALGRTVVHLIEPQQLFVPALLDVFAEAGFTVEDVATGVDPRTMLNAQPEIVFMDTDFVDEPLENVRLVHVLCPHADIIVYSSARTEAIARAFTAAGAYAVFDKSQSREAIVEGLRSMHTTRHGQS